jgi:hypothetical protein
VPAPLLGLVAGAAGLTMLLGFAGTWRILGTPVAPHLRHE